MKDEPSGAPQSDAPAESVPDWSTISRELHCPLCEYNLRGLVEPRCPECGFAFEWEVVLNPSLQIHPYLFEHHPRQPVRFFWLTLRGGLRPGRFWTTLKPTHAIFPRRIVAYWLMMITMALAGLAISALILLFARELAGQRLVTLLNSRPFRPTTLRITPLPFRLRFWSTSLWWRSFILPLVGWVAALEVVLPWLTLATLMIFQTSLRRSGIKSVHLMRCVLYSSDALLWANLFALCAAIAAFLYWLITKQSDPNRILRRDVALAVIAYFYLPIWGVVCYRLHVACRKYLQLKQVAAMIIASQVIVALAVPAAIVLFYAVKELF